MSLPQSVRVAGRILSHIPAAIERGSLIDITWRLQIHLSA
jgi:hypothetical protein